MFFYSIVRLCDLIRVCDLKNYIYIRYKGFVGSHVLAKFCIKCYYVLR